MSLCAARVGLLFIIVAGGCRSFEDVIEAKSEGTAKVYRVDEERAWKISKRILRELGCDAIYERRRQGAVFADTGLEPFSYGALVGVWIKPRDENRTKVTVCTKRKLATNIATGLKETTFHDLFAKSVREKRRRR